MKNLLWAAAAVSLSVPSVSLAGGHEGDGDGAPAGGPPPAVLSTINLGGAGLLFSFYANSQKGSTAGRGGRDSSRIGSATNGGPASGYEHSTFTFLPSIAGSKMIQNGTAFLTFGLSYNYSDEAPNQTESTSRITGLSVGYENFSSRESAWSVGLTVEERTTESETSPITTGAENVELRFAYVRELSENWGIGNQSYLTFGDSYVTTPGGTTNTDEVELYTQFELVGSFDNSHVGFVPDGWKLHPVFGISYQNAVAQDEGGPETTSVDGSVWAKAILAGPARPGTWAPNFTLGLEHVYTTDTGDQFIDEDTYAILGAGARYIGDNGSFVVALERRQGLNGVRDTTSLVTGYTFDF